MASWLSSAPLRNSHPLPTTRLCSFRRVLTQRGTHHPPDRSKPGPDWPSFLRHLPRAQLPLCSPPASVFPEFLDLSRPTATVFTFPALSEPPPSLPPAPRPLPVLYAANTRNAHLWRAVNALTILASLTCHLFPGARNSHRWGFTRIDFIFSGTLTLGDLTCAKSYTPQVQ